ncbi:MAG TPA: methyltransferase domain-containing protein [Candidatus Eisenbacteria bacterium]|jgi:cyclopropane fatty-acyl-phospholipid synthase-like methyltransferase|nr:methyltransferase domain-containing protein [Candidatus Eisenbacteria bacterium]
MREFLPKFFGLVGPGMTALDLGAGPGQQTLRMAELGARVYAVDRSFEPVSHPGVLWRKTTVQDWLAGEGSKVAFDVVLARNVFPFIEKDYVRGTLVPTITASMPAGGVFAASAFFQDPEPPFPRPLLSLWTLDELQAMFPGWESVHAWAGSFDGPDMQGATRRFHACEIIVKKP